MVFKSSSLSTEPIPKQSVHSETDTFTKSHTIDALKQQTESSHTSAVARQPGLNGSTLNIPSNQSFTQVNMTNEINQSNDINQSLTSNQQNQQQNEDHPRAHQSLEISATWTGWGSNFLKQAQAITSHHLSNTIEHAKLLAEESSHLIQSTKISKIGKSHNITLTITIT